MQSGASDTPMHGLFKWVPVEAGGEFQHLTPEEVAKKHGVPENLLTKHIDSEIKGDADLLSLPWAILSVILYAMVLMTHTHTALHNSVEHAIEFDIEENANFAFSAPEYMGHKGMNDVNCFADFYSWMNKGFMPLYSPEEVPVSEDSGLDLGKLSKEKKMKYLWRNTKVGPVKLSQEHAEIIQCPNEDLASQYNYTCTRSPTVDLDLRPAERIVLQSAFLEEESKTVWLNGFGEDSQQKLKDLETGLWLDSRTNIVRVSFLTYDGDTDILRLTSINFLFSRAGHIWKRFTQKAVTLDAYAGIRQYVVDICFYLQVTLLCCAELYEIAVHLRKRRSLLGGLREYIGVWNAVDWIFILISYLILGLWLMRVFTVKDIQDTILDIPPEAQACSSNCSLYYAEVFNQVNDIGITIDQTRLVSSFFPLVVCLRLFKAFSSQPRLAIVTETLRLAAPNLAHYLIVFMSLFIAYAVMGVALFGREMVSFATLDRAVPSLFLMALGDYDFETSEVIGRGFAFIFYLGFMVVVVMVMLSMLIAIVMDVYVEVKELSGRSEPLWTEAYNIARRSWMNYRKTRLSLPVIRGRLDPQSTEVVFARDFLDRVPGLPTDQAKRLIVSTIREYQNNNHYEPDTLDVKQFIDASVRKLTRAMEVPQKDTKAGPSTPPPEEELGCVSRTSAGAGAAYLEALSLEDLMKLAVLKLDAGCSVPPYEGSEEAIRQVLRSARGIIGDLAYTINC